MRIISRDANLDDIRAAIREWIAILAQERFDEAAYWLATEDAEFFEPSDEFDAAPRTWSGNKLQAIIANFGIGGDLRGDVIDGRIHVPAPVSPAIVKDFEQHLRVHFFMDQMMSSMIPKMLTWTHESGAFTSISH